MRHRSAFIEIITPSSIPTARVRRGVVEIWLRRGVLVRLRRGADPDLVRIVVATLTERRPC